MQIKTPYANPIHFPDDLPIVAHLPEIQRALENHQVIVVAGETGSGKTTQLPKLLLSLGYGAKGLIGHTQPRRIAASSVARRLAEELKVSVGQEIGYQVRFSQHLSEHTYVKVMTDGILLAELAQDRFLKRYDALIIDEAHERSLNIDFILGYLKWLLPKRLNLKIIITSATLDHQRFSAHFNGCPVIEVSGRSYPVDIAYQPLKNHDNQDLAQMKGVLEAIQNLESTGDILVFLSGEREIRQTTEFLRKSGLRYTEILPLFSKLSVQEQQKIFHPGHLRRIILSTNVAETSLTIPNIYYVIDTGTARIKRYNYRSKIQRLLVEPISKASAKQRAGRCGRVAPGICIRLYAEEEFNLREAYTQPEILRSNLANVILQMLLLRLGDPEQFPWLDAPESQYWKDAYQCLEELRAIERVDETWQLTEIGKHLAKLPVDPRLGRMLITAQEKLCLAEVLTIVSALSVGDIFQRPMDQRQAADEKHRQFFAEGSDFLTYITLWQSLNEYQHHHSNNKLRKFCEANFLSYLKFKEWQDMVNELASFFTSPLVGALLKNKFLAVIASPRSGRGNPGFRDNLLKPGSLRFARDDGNYSTKSLVGEAKENVDAIHHSILSGLLTHVAMKDEGGEYIAARQRRLKIFPGSALSKKNPPWIMAMEIVETKQVYARTVAQIDAAWIEALAPHLIKKNYHDPHWDSRGGEVLAYEKVLFFGLPIIQKRRVRYARIDPELSHEVFLRQALAQRQLQSAAKFWIHNEKFLTELEQLEERTRSRHFVPDEEWLYAFYVAKIPQEISNRVDLEKWIKKCDDATKKSLEICAEDLENAALKKQLNIYPTEFEWQNNSLKLHYQFSPASPEDGVTVEVPLVLLPALVAEPFDWLVPGFLEEKVAALLKALPKEQRQALMPLNESAKLCCQALLKHQEGNFYEALSEALQANFHLDVSPAMLRAVAIPDFLKFNFKIVDEGKMLAMSRDLLMLKEKFLSYKVATEDAQVFQGWDFGCLAESVLSEHQGLQLKKYPALQAVERGVKVVFVEDLAIAKQIHLFGVANLLRLRCKDILNYVRKKLLSPKMNAAEAKMLSKAFKVKASKPQALEEDFLAYVDYALIFMNFAEDFWQIRDSEAFEACLITHQKDLIENAQMLVPVVVSILTQSTSNEFEFIAQTPWEWLERYPLYLAARAANADESAKVAAQLAPLEIQYHALVEAHCRQQGYAFESLQHFVIAKAPKVFFSVWQCLPEPLRRFHYLLEELRMHLLVPRFKPIESVSVVRLEKLLEL